MLPRAQQLVQDLALEPHPEGGFYRRFYASESLAEDGRLTMTAIQYLLSGEDFSAFHRIQSDELWMLGEHSSAISIVELSDQGPVITELNASKPCYCVKANTWFAAYLSAAKVDQQAYALLYCSVSPGFDFKQFELAKQQNLLDFYPDSAALIKRLCRD